MSLGKSQGHRGHRKVKCEISQALVMINLYVKFNVHSSYAKQVILLKVADRRTDGRTDAPGCDNRHPPKFRLRPKKYNKSAILIFFRNYGTCPKTCY